MGVQTSKDANGKGRHTYMYMYSCVYKHLDSVSL